MKIAFYPSNIVPIHAESIEERPLGGTETVIIRLSEALSLLGHTVYVFTPISNPELSSPIYLPYRALQDLGPVDLLIAVREWQALFYPIEAKKRFFLTGDAWDLTQSFGIGDLRVTKQIDAFITASSWQTNTICQKSGFPKEKCFILPHGVHLPYFAKPEQRIRKRLIYSSTPYRGLALLAEIFPKLLKLHPEAELHIFSGFDVYAGVTGIAQELVDQAQKLLSAFSNIPQCFIHGNVLQGDLAIEFLRSSVLAYPNTFDETYCITIREAQAAGCVPVTSARAALPEVVANAGILIDGEPGSAEYNDKFVAALDLLLKDDQVWNTYSQACLDHSAKFNWLDLAKSFENFITGNQLPI